MVNNLKKEKEKRTAVKYLNIGLINSSAKINVLINKRIKIRVYPENEYSCFILNPEYSGLARVWGASSNHPNESGC